MLVGSNELNGHITFLIYETFDCTYFYYSFKNNEFKINSNICETTETSLQNPGILGLHSALFLILQRRK